MCVCVCVCTLIRLRHLLYDLSNNDAFTVANIAFSARYEDLLAFCERHGRVIDLKYVFFLRAIVVASNEINPICFCFYVRGDICALVMYLCKILFSSLSLFVFFFCSLSLQTDKETGKSKGYAFCEYADSTTAQRAIPRLHNAEFCGRNIKAHSRADRSFINKRRRENEEQHSEERTNAAASMRAGSSYHNHDARTSSSSTAYEPNTYGNDIRRPATATPDSAHQYHQCNYSQHADPHGNMGLHQGQGAPSSFDASTYGHYHQQGTAMYSQSQQQQPQQQQQQQQQYYYSQGLPSSSSQVPPHSSTAAHFAQTPLSAHGGAAAVAPPSDSALASRDSLLSSARPSTPIAALPSSLPYGHIPSSSYYAGQVQPQAQPQVQMQTSLPPYSNMNPNANVNTNASVLSSYSSQHNPNYQQHAPLSIPATAITPGGAYDAVHAAPAAFYTGATGHTLPYDSMPQTQTTMSLEHAARENTTDYDRHNHRHRHASSSPQTASSSSQQQRKKNKSASSSSSSKKGKRKTGANGAGYPGKHYTRIGSDVAQSAGPGSASAPPADLANTAQDVMRIIGQDCSHRLLVEMKKWAECMPDRAAHLITHYPILRECILVACQQFGIEFPFCVKSTDVDNDAAVAAWRGREAVTASSPLSSQQQQYTRVHQEGSTPAGVPQQQLQVQQLSVGTLPTITTSPSAINDERSKLYYCSPSRSSDDGAANGGNDDGNTAAAAAENGNKKRRVEPFASELGVSSVLLQQQQPSHQMPASYAQTYTPDYIQLSQAEMSRGIADTTAEATATIPTDTSVSAPYGASTTAAGYASSALPPPFMHPSRYSSIELNNQPSASASPAARVSPTAATAATAATPATLSTQGPNAVVVLSQSLHSSAVSPQPILSPTLVSQTSTEQLQQMLAKIPEQNRRAVEMCLHMSEEQFMREIPQNLQPNLRMLRARLNVV